MRRTVRLGDLARGRVFWFSGRRYKVTRNLGVAGVSVQSQSTREVKVGGRTFAARTGGTEVWSASSPVEVETRAPAEDRDDGHQ